MLVGGTLGSSSKLVERVVIARVLSQSAYGEVALGISVMSLSTTVALVGLDTGIARYMSRLKTSREVRGVWVTGLIISLVVSVVLAALLLVGGSWIVGLLFEQPGSRELLTLFVLAIPFGVGFRIAIGAIRGLENTIYRTYARDLFYNGVRLGLIVALLLAGVGVSSAGYAYLFAGVATFVLAHLLLNRLLSLRGEITIRPKQLLLFSIPLVLSAMTSKLLGEVDTLMLGYFRTTAEVGVYDAAYQLAAGLPALMSSFGFLYMPLTSRLDAEGNHEEINSIYKVTTKWVYIAGFPIFLVFVGFSADVVALFFGETYAEGGTALWIIATGFFVSAAYGRAQDTLAAFGHTRVILWINVIAAVLNVLLNAVLIPRYGFLGAAMATALSFATLNGLAFAILWNSFGITPFSRWSTRTFVLLPLVLIPPVLLVSRTVTLSLVLFPLSGVLAGLATLGVVALTGCLQPEDEIPVELVENRLDVAIPVIRRFIPADD
ncbi:flippase [Halococcus agarilyticus]|uniref:flippase n=1 Tax=Halococcus agarilyticus TaxID=1232219 RepID=UPI000677EBF7|nr:flippase [Halococcus agarilyticus]